MKPEVGKWYYAEYGYDIVAGKCIAVFEKQEACFLSFRWGDPYRTNHLVENNRILSETQDPTLIAKIKRMFK
jgi:hypothetical protein